METMARIVDVHATAANWITVHMDQVATRFLMAAHMLVGVHMSHIQAAGSQPGSYEHEDDDSCDRSYDPSII